MAPSSSAPTATASRRRRTPADRSHMRVQSETVPTDVIDLDPLVLRGATIEQALAQHGATLGLEPSGPRVRVLGQLVCAAHTFTAPERGTLIVEALRGTGDAQIAVRAPG